jgi:hypothetical protein
MSMLARMFLFSRITASTSPVLAGRHIERISDSAAVRLKGRLRWSRGSIRRKGLDHKRATEGQDRTRLWKRNSRMPHPARANRGPGATESRTDLRSGACGPDGFHIRAWARRIEPVMDRGVLLVVELGIIVKDAAVFGAHPFTRTGSEVDLRFRSPIRSSSLRLP